MTEVQLQKEPEDIWVISRFPYQIKTTVLFIKLPLIQLLKKEPNTNNIASTVPKWIILFSLSSLLLAPSFHKKLSGKKEGYNL